MTNYRFVFTVDAETQREAFIKDNVPYCPSHAVTFYSENMTQAERSWVSALWFNGDNKHILLYGKPPGAYGDKKFEQFSSYKPSFKEILIRWIKTNDEKPEYLEKAGIADEWWAANGYHFRTSLMDSIVLGLPFTFDIHK